MVRVWARELDCRGSNSNSHLLAVACGQVAQPLSALVSSSQMGLMHLPDRIVVGIK